MVRYIFISYRRVDTTLAAFWIDDILKRTFNNLNIFIDSEGVEGGEDFPTKIINALGRSEIFLLLIGENWLKTHDHFGRRRIDDPSDWVRLEIETALSKNITIIPILIGSTSLPQKEALPESISKITDFQSLKLRESYWLKDVKVLIKRLEQLGLKHKGIQVNYPIPNANTTTLTEDELKTALTRTPKWTVVHKEDSEGGLRKGIQKTYHFKSFSDAIHFINTSARHMEKIDHHPEWENIWRTVSVWTTSWDVGHLPTFKDFELAEYLDNLFLSYQ